MRRREEKVGKYLLSRSGLVMADDYDDGVIQTDDKCILMETWISPSVTYREMRYAVRGFFSFFGLILVSLEPMFFLFVLCFLAVRPSFLLLFDRYVPEDACGR